jgi:hypothetical protein
MLAGRVGVSVISLRPMIGEGAASEHDISIRFERRADRL